MTEETPTPPASDPDDTTTSTEFAEALESFEATTEAPTRTEELAVGARVQAKVVSIGEEHLLLDVGGRSEAVAETKLFRDAEGKPKVNVGDTLDLYVVSAPDPTVLAPAMRSERQAALGRLRDALTSGIPVTGKVASLNAGGLSVDLGGARGFCPFSQVDAGFCPDPSIYVGKTLEFLITEVKDGRGGVVLSRKKLLRRHEEESGKKLLATLKVGDELEGTVARLETFGAFVDLGGVDGLIHVSEIRHERTHHPKDALKEGEKVQVRVVRLETGKDGRPRIALSMKASRPDPWTGIEERYVRGARIKGTVVRLTDFGAFVQLEPGIDGLVHVSEVSAQRVEHVKDALTKGQEIEAVVLGADAAKKRISLSIKATSMDSLPEPGPSREGREGREGRGGREGREGRPPRGGRPDREPRERRGGGGGGRRSTTLMVSVPLSPDEPPPMTTMAIALREAMERAKEKSKASEK